MYGPDPRNTTVHPHLILSDHHQPNNLTNSTRPKLSPETEEHFHRLRDGFLFSRWFILTYQPVVVGVVLVVAAWRWRSSRARVRRRGKRRTVEKQWRRDGNERSERKKDDIVVDNGEGSSSSSSSSSTREGNATPPTTDKDKTSDEWTRLLESERTDPADGKTSPWQTVSRWTKYSLTYQPAPIPLINKILPPNTTSLWILTLFALNILYLLANIGISHSTQDIIADRAGLLFTANLPWLYFLAAKTQPLKLLTGDSYENLNMLHRRLGEWMCFLAFIHLAGMIWGWFDFLQQNLSLVAFLTIPYILWGCGAWVAYEILYFMSLGSFREWWYEVFLGGHVLLQAGGLVLLWLHHFRARPYVLACGVIFVLDRFAWRLGVKGCVVQAELKVLDDGETVLVCADWPVLTKKRAGVWWRRILGWDIRYSWNPSEHVFISVPGMGRKYKYQFHPMTIASAAPAPGQTHAWFNLIIRAKGGFSRDLLHYAQTTPTTQIRLDGPYGSLHALEMLHESDISIIVAGGSGIAVAYPLLWSLLHHNSPLDGAETPPRKQQICLIWIIQDASHVSWIGSERLDELKELGLHLVIPPPSRRYGRPDVQGLLEEKVEELRDGGEGEEVGVIVSGPDGLNRMVQNCCAGMVRRGVRVEVGVEKFGW
ncbi:hypothetical protein PRZ48_015189 [Zasmidium cellare]|uniref:FAD-binding FR-type domain-containing protein n=1 Tax=Zasmidium cellare TaxID=395010 RepID=A0ABR0DYE0_ZASCE|nr:hypothetical protein PRZ48_015189 [Zasmidium cellare]